MTAKSTDDTVPAVVAARYEPIETDGPPLIPTDYGTDIKTLAENLEALDGVVSMVMDDVEALTSRSQREVALGHSVQLHVAINYRAHSSDIDVSVTDTADTLLEWLQR